MLTMAIALAGISIIADVTTRLEAKGHLGELVIGVVHEFPWRQGGQITINETTKVTVVRLHNAVVVMPWVMLAAHVLFVLLSLGVFIRDTSIEVAIAYWVSCVALLIVQLAGKIVVALCLYTIFNDVTRPDLTSGNKAYVHFDGHLTHCMDFTVCTGLSLLTIAPLAAAGALILSTFWVKKKIESTLAYVID